MGSSPADQRRAACGGLEGGESNTAACGGLEGGESVMEKAELASTQAAPKAIKLSFI